MCTQQLPPIFFKRDLKKDLEKEGGHLGQKQSGSMMDLGKGGGPVAVDLGHTPRVIPPRLMSTGTSEVSPLKTSSSASEVSPPKKRPNPYKPHIPKKTSKPEEEEEVLLGEDSDDGTMTIQVRHRPAPKKRPVDGPANDAKAAKAYKSFEDRWSQKKVESSKTKSASTSETSTVTKVSSNPQWMRDDEWSWWWPDWRANRWDHTEIHAKGTSAEHSG
ncbi:unnamed protein product, partial [Durusdinium trenchii]